MKLHLVCVTALAAALTVSVAGCKSSKSHDERGTTTAPTTSNTNAPPASNTTAPPASAAVPTFAAFYNATPAVVGEAIIDIIPLPAGDLVVGQSAGGLNRIDVNGQPALETSIGTVGNLAEDNGTIFAAGELGQVHERSGATWALSYTHATLPQTVVASFNGDVYSFNSLLGTDPVTGVVLPAQVSQRVAGSAVWTPDVAAMPNVQITAAAPWNTTVWAGGSDNSVNTGGPRLFHGTGATWTEITLPNTAGANELEIVTKIISTPTKLWVSTMVIDTLSSPAIAVGGNVYETTDGVTFTGVAAFTGDSPISMAWHEATLFVGTLAGRLFHEETTGFIEETNLPTNLGVFALASQDADTLLIGLRGSAGAELVTRESPPPAANNAPPAAAALTYTGDVRPVLMARCTACHANTANAGFTSYPLSVGLTDTTADYNETRMRANLVTPDASPLLRKAVGLDGHGGGASIAQGSADYNTLQQWIVDQAPQ